MGLEEDGKDQLDRHVNKCGGATNSTGRKMSYGCDLRKENELDRSYTHRRKPAEGGDRRSDDRKKPRGRNDWETLLSF